MGVVYLARDPNIERLVAVKVMRQDRMGNEFFVKRFVKEAKVIGRLSHPHTVTVHDIGEEKGDIYIAMEYIEGTSLSDIIKEKRLDAKEVVEFGVQIAETLEYAHQKGVIHRDIKPSNIIVQPDGQIKITDFGIAHIEDSNASIQTQAGETMGTPSYMSPEQVLGQSVDGRSDLFSLGVVLYELSTGKRPFGGDGKTLATVFNEIIQITPTDPNIALGKVPRELSTLIMKALRKEPEKRFQSGKELAEALKVCLGGGKRENVATTIPTPPVQGKRPGYVIPLASAVLISIVAGVIFFFSHHKEPSPVKPPSESRQASPKEPRRTGLMKPSLPPPAPTIRKTEAPARVMPKESGKPAQQNGGAQTLLPVKSKPLPKFAFLKVRTIPKGATVYVNGIQKGRSPLTLKLDLGKYRVKLCREGYRDTECLVNLDRMTEFPLVEKLRPTQ